MQTYNKQMDFGLEQFKLNLNSLNTLKRLVKIIVKILVMFILVIVKILLEIVKTFKIVVRYVEPQTGRGGQAV